MTVFKTLPIVLVPFILSTVAHAQEATEGQLTESPGFPTLTLLLIVAVVFGVLLFALLTMRKRARKKAAKRGEDI